MVERAGTLWKPSKRPTYGTRWGRIRHCARTNGAQWLILEHLPDRLVGLFHMAVRLCVGHAFVQQPGVQFVETFDPEARREEPFPHQPDLVLDLSLLPTGRRGAGDGLDQVMAAHLQEAAIVMPFLAGEVRLHRRLPSPWP
jgi:hypothetical protein